jgi:pimeloyl-ACP methyl ester carboxylesterase
VPKALVNGIRIYYDVYGQGEPVLLIMGLGASALGWQNQIPTLSQHLRVVAYDNRDAGRSDKVEAEYSIADMADDAAALLDHLGIDSAHAYGVSMGGIIAQELALRHPRRVRTLVLGCTSPCPMAAPPSEKAVRDMAAAAELPAREAFDRSIWMGYSDSYLAVHRDDLWLRAQAEAGLQPPLEAWRRQYAAATRFDARERVGQIGTPTLVMTGDEDPLMPPENSRFLAEHIPGAQLIVFLGGRHGFNVEFEEESNRAVLDFVERHSGVAIER